MSLYRGWSPLSTDPGNLGLTIFALLWLAVAIAGLGYVLVPALHGVASVILVGLFVVVGVLLVLLVVRAVQLLTS